MADPSETTQVSSEHAVPERDELLDAVRALSVQVHGLQSEVQALRQESRGLPANGTEQAGWDDGRPVVRESPAWVRSVDSPMSRRIAVPWLLLEILFLVGVAILAVVADLDAPVIVAVMLVAWLLVAAGEWLLSRAALRDRAFVYSVATQETGLPDDPRWFATGAEDTALDHLVEDRTAARLPPPQPE